MFSDLAEQIAARDLLELAPVERVEDRFTAFRPMAFNVFDMGADQRPLVVTRMSRAGVRGPQAFEGSRRIPFAREGLAARQPDFSTPMSIAMSTSCSISSWQDGFVGNERLHAAAAVGAAQVAAVGNRGGGCSGRSCRGRLPAKRRVRTDGRRVGLRSWNCPVVVRRRGRRGGGEAFTVSLLAGVASRAVPLFTCGLGHASGLLEFAREIDVEEGQGLGPGIDDARLQLFGDHEVELPEVAGAGLFEKGQAGRFVDGDERSDESSSACWNVVMSAWGRAPRASMRRRSVGTSTNGRSHESTRIGCRSSRSADHTSPSGRRPGFASGMERMPGRARFLRPHRSPAR